MTRGPKPITSFAGAIPVDRVRVLAGSRAIVFMRSGSMSSIRHDGISVPGSTVIGAAASDW